MRPIKRMLLFSKNPAFTLTATTSASNQTVTIQRLTLSVDTYVDWGDGSRTPLPANTTSSFNHTYASARAYRIRIPQAKKITAIDLRDSKLGQLRTAQLRSSPITYFYVTAVTDSTISSSDMAAWRPSSWGLASMPTGNYTVNSANMAAWTSLQYLSCYSMPTGAVSISAASDFTGLVSLRNLQLQSNALSQASVDKVLQGLWNGKANFTDPAPSCNVGGSNSAPSGIYQPASPPTTGKEYAYDLVNGTCKPDGPEWTVTFTA